MVAVGIDVSKGKSTVAVVGERKKVIQKPFDVMHTKTDLQALIAFIKSLGDEVQVVMEHTGIYYKVVAETLSTAGICVSAVNPVLIAQFGNNTLRNIKTDKKDALKIARYAIENFGELRKFSTEDEIRDTLKSFVRQYNFESKTLIAHRNHLNALLERAFPGIDGIFDSNSHRTKPNGHQKLIDFVIQFWHNDLVANVSESKFVEKYRKFCKKNCYIFKEATAKEIHKMSRNNLTTLTKSDTTKLLVQGVAKRILFLSQELEALRTEMVNLAKQLPEFETVKSIYGVSDNLASQLIGETGDVRRFKDKFALVAYAGVDPGKNDSGKKVSTSGSVSRSGDALLRKAVYLAVEAYLLSSPADEPVYQFLDKKRSEGKHFYVYMTAACNKFLRIYYGRVMEFFENLEKSNEVETVA